MLRMLIAAIFAVLFCAVAGAQLKSEVKRYPRGTMAGEVALLEQWSESDGLRSSTVYAIEVPVSACYSLAVITNLQKGINMPVLVDGKAMPHQFTTTESGWQKTMASSITKNDACGVYLTAGRHLLVFPVNSNMPPLIDELSCSRSGNHTGLDADWNQFSQRLTQWVQDKPVSNVPAADKANSLSGKVLNNPSGNYEHAIDTAFAYTTMQWVYLTAGTTYTFSTSGSTIDPVLHLFDPANVDAYSWWSDDSNGTWESTLTVTIPTTGSYYLLARPYYGGQSGTTSIAQNGSAYLSNTPISGLRFNTTSRTGNLNYFTARLTGTTPDTRIFTIKSSGTNVTGYNDDYSNSSGGTWNWFLASRIKKNYATGSTVVFVSSYSAARTGFCDVYMGNTNATIPTTFEASNFPLLKGEDAIQTAPSEYYNCISWSGGITTSWVWPIDPSSTWYVANNPLGSFDKFYSNTPQRYPGAWNYTRSGATAANAAVDLWKTASAYTHASVTKPGNAHPHGYDWESKPGGLDRTLHPRNSLENPSWYGAVTNYYKFAGTYSRMNTGFTTDIDAVNAGLAVIDKASLTNGAQQKLRTLIAKNDLNISGTFEMLYQAWDKTKAKNLSMSDPYMYCNNAEYERLAAFCQRNTDASMYLVFDKYVNSNDHFLSKLLVTLTTAKYGHLLTEVREERLANPNDAQGRYKIHGDHDNGVLYIEKILKQLSATDATATMDEAISVIVSPNPVKDQFTVQVVLKNDSRISVQAISTRSRITRTLQAESTLQAGTHRFTANARNFGSGAGDIIAVQVMINGVMQTVKVLTL
ncbi:MAG: PPC domain-containing protein [Bacteroidetes bacterium]|nr:PPC domain-containing protein [Bacteroidota bacterium]